MDERKELLDALTTEFEEESAIFTIDDVLYIEEGGFPILNGEAVIMLGRFRIDFTMTVFVFIDRTGRICRRFTSAPEELVLPRLKPLR